MKNERHQKEVDSIVLGLTSLKKDLRKKKIPESLSNAFSNVLANMEDALIAADTIVNKDDLEMTDDDVIEYLITDLNQQLFSKTN